MLRKHETLASRSLSAVLLAGVAAMSAGCNDAAPAPTAQYEDRTSEAARTAPADPYASTAPSQPSQPDAPAASPDDGEQTVASFLGIRAPKPASWVEKPPQSMMHHTTFDVPGDDGAADAQIVVFFFGRGQGGPIDANIARWEDQFRSPDGSDVRAAVRTFEADGLPVTLVELEGEYRGMGAIYAPNQRFITAIVDTPGDQRIFIRFVGDHATVTAHRNAFITMIEEMEWIGN